MERLHLQQPHLQGQIITISFAFLRSTYKQILIKFFDFEGIFHQYLRKNKASQPRILFTYAMKSTWRGTTTVLGYHKGNN
jgi:hypothetical protein